MKVLHVIPSISHVHGGPSIALEAMTRALAQAGVAVDVATTDDDGAGHLDVPLGAPVLRDGVTYWFFRRQTQFYKFSLPLTRWLARNVARYDVAHIHALFSYATVPASFYAARAHVPYIVRPLGTLNQYGMRQHHALIKKISFPLVERRILARAARVHYTSAQEKLEAEALGVTQPSVILPLGVAIAQDEIARVRLPGEPLRILFLSRLDPKKGLDLLLPAFAALRAREVNAQLIIAGDGEDDFLNDVKRRAQELQLGAAVQWMGFITGDAKTRLLCDADIFVLPSYSENFGIAAVEAMGAGLPVIVTTEVGIADEIAEAGAGTVVAPGATALQQALAQLCADGALRDAMGARGRALARSRYSTEATTRALIDLYRDVILTM